MSVKTPVAPRIQHASDPLVPHLAFEWHEHTQKVYVAKVPGRYESGAFVPAASRTRRWVCVTEHCEHHAMFYGFVQTLLRGYKMAAADYANLRESALVRRAEELKHSGLLRGETD